MRIVYIGTGDIGLPALGWLIASGHEIAAVFTQPDKPSGRRMELIPSPIKQRAVEQGIPVFQPVKMRAPDSVAQVQGLAADLIIVMAYGQILPKGVLDAARIACLNLHASILPRHRGAAPIQSAILAGDAESGITVMYMDEGLDTGDILLIHPLPIGPRETGGSLHDRLAAATPPALAEAISLLETGNAPRTPQDNALATYAKKLGREDGEINWSRPCVELDRQVRALNPWPGAYTFLPQARKLKIHEGAPVDNASGAAGEILRADANGILVACGSGGLLLREIQLEGKRRMTAREFLPGHPLAAGTLLGHANS